MVAMGSSLADRAWGRESAVYRITGVLSVIGGWFITAGAAFTICFLVAIVIYFGGIAAMAAMVGLAVYMLIRSQIAYKKKMKKEALKEEVNTTVAKLRDTTDSREALFCSVNIAVKNYSRYCCFYCGCTRPLRPWFHE